MANITLNPSQMAMYFQELTLHSELYTEPLRWKRVHDTALALNMNLQQSHEVAWQRTFPLIKYYLILIESRTNKWASDRVVRFPLLGEK